jgi:hydrogenase small subunit
MSTLPTLGDALGARGVSRRAFLKFCTALTSLMALPPSMAPAARRRSPRRGVPR